jgi:hypothetical protein
MVLNIAGMGDFFSQTFDPFLNPINKPSRKKVNEIIKEIPNDNILITGNAFEFINKIYNKSSLRKVDLNILYKKDIYPLALDLAKISLKNFEKVNEKNFNNTLDPVYLKPHYAKLKNSNSCI